MFGSKRIKLLMATVLSVLSVFVLTSKAKVEASDNNLEYIHNGFPYHPLVYHLDLSIFAYQIHGQSLIWRFDPFYEELNDLRWNRAKYMKKVHSWAVQQGLEQVGNQRIGIAAIRGPGILSGFPNNPSHDPILYNYNQVDPWSHSINYTNGSWTEYLTPTEITQTIQSAYICYRTNSGLDSSVSFSEIIVPHPKKPRDTHDTLYIFEGGTGDKGELGQPASQSLMGFVLARHKPNRKNYDLHIAFRGSRSGSAARAVGQAFSDNYAKGNPDWVTDLGYDRLSAADGGSYISTVGKVHRGFAYSIKSIFPNLMHCLEKTALHKRGVKPDNIYVTGHSLGGALAQQFVSAILLGDEFGPNGLGKGMPSSLKEWPWTQVKLVTYGAPRVGDETFAKTLTVSSLQSDFFSTTLNPIDLRALKVTDDSILPRLLDPLRPVGYRVLNSKDPITTEKVAGGKHVGKTIYVNRPRPIDLLSPPDFSAHDQQSIRNDIFLALKEDNIPSIAMRIRAMTEINPYRDESQKGSRKEMRKLIDATKQWHADNNVWFDEVSYNSYVELRFQIEDRIE